MPIYEDKINTLTELTRIQKQNVCAECGEGLALFINAFTDDRTYLACTDYLRTHHEGISRPPSQYEKEGLGAFNIPKRRELLTEEYGDKIKSVAKYQGATALTISQANEILVAIYPDAPPEERKRAVLLCASYGLNPLMKHVYLLPFKNKKTGTTDWATVISIIAKRLMASRRGSYSYIDDTPRVMSDKEQMKIFGKVDRNKIRAITKLKDTKTGAEVSGYGFWPADAVPYGCDKGNSAENMAFIRSESQGLSKLYPGEMPQDFDVVPGEYADSVIEISGKVIAENPSEKDQDVVEGEAVEIIEETAPPLGNCPVHNIPLTPGSKPGYPPYCRTRVPNGKGKEVWCRGVAPTAKEEATKSTTSPETEGTNTMAPPESETAGYDSQWVKDSLRELNWSEPTAKSWLSSKFGIDTTGPLLPDAIDRMTTEQRDVFFREISSRLDMKKGGV